MARKDEDAAPDAPAAGEDLGQAELQAKADEAAEKGYIGSTPDPFPNEAYSLQSGPDSPTIVEQQAAILDARTQDAKASAGQEA